VEKEEKKAFTFYANSVNIKIGIYDVMLKFSFREPSSETKDKEDSIDNLDYQLVNVVMSPQHALVFSKLLSKMLKRYEEEVGQISLPKKMLKDIGLGDENE